MVSEREKRICANLGWVGVGSRPSRVFFASLIRQGAGAGLLFFVVLCLRLLVGAWWSIRLAVLDSRAFLSSNAAEPRGFFLALGCTTPAWLSLTVQCSHCFHGAFRHNLSPFFLARVSWLETHRLHSCHPLLRGTFRLPSQSDSAVQGQTLTLPSPCGWLGPKRLPWKVATCEEKMTGRTTWSRAPSKIRSPPIKSPSFHTLH